MLLVFGGTTEGRKAIETLEDSGNTFYYSTKTGEQDVPLHHGVAVSGAMDATAMITFCQEHNIKLLVDASHPFAEVLHQTVAEVAEKLHLPAIRFERIFPPREEDITWIDDYSDLYSKVHGGTLLATTGVQSISKLKPLETQGGRVIYRILNRESSIKLAHQQGATDEQLCFYPNTADADAILMKESGLSGGFLEKVEEARKLGMQMYAIKRPETPTIFHCVNGEHGLRRMVEKLLPDFYPLHSGLTTGTCATAAAVAATIRLLTSETPEKVPVILPNGETIHVPVGYANDYAYCIKEAGDDPDVTDGIEIRAQVEPSDHFEICAGVGVGKFTLPGFDYPPGEPAINKSPRQMIYQNVTAVANSSLFTFHFSLKVTISVPQGEAIAQRTFNPRLGIEGGISIIGVSGIVKPFSEEAFIESIRKCMEVAKASGTERVVLHSGMKSEGFLQTHYPTLPQQAFVEYGNAIGATLQIANELDIPHITLGIMLGKAVKLAEGHLDTHSKKQTMNKTFIVQMLEESGCTPAVIDQVADITLARELWGIIPPEQVEAFCQTVIRHCTLHCKPLIPHSELTILLIDDVGTIHSL
ncbi:MAG: cobalt-precorrin-5B (C(1))-methyltransferase [Bacteroidaceae bacterium]|nr:cobalt-precorrin-5B (C(1))-methyltransferase [Bacteroidaceae bacterium]